LFDDENESNNIYMEEQTILKHLHQTEAPKKIESIQTLREAESNDEDAKLEGSAKTEDFCSDDNLSACQEDLSSSESSIHISLNSSTSMLEKN
jgi:hypothetical protein